MTAEWLLLAPVAVVGFWLGRASAEVRRRPVGYVAGVGREEGLPAPGITVRPGCALVVQHEPPGRFSVHAQIKLADTSPNVSLNHS